MSSTLDPYDELAAMFITAEATEDTDRVATTTELLLVGHLPVRAGLWLTPYADLIAREAGPTALVRLEARRTAVQLLQGSTDSAPPSSSDGDFERVLATLARTVSNWIIRVPQETTPEAMLDARSDRITLLSSANDAAVFEAYRQIKALVRCAEISRVPLPELGLVVVGADDHAARQMHEKLHRTIESFLNADLPLRRVLARMDPTISTTRTMAFDLLEAPTLERTVTAISTGPADDAFTVESRLPEASQSYAALESMTPPPIPSGPAVRPAEPFESSTESDAIRDEVELDTPTRILPFHAVASRGADSARLSPKPSVQVEAKDETMAITEPDANGAPVPLSSYVDGLRALPIRCPDHERIELAIDAVGALHLLGRDELLRDMKVVESWVVKHRELIGMACPKHGLDLTGRAVMHAFTDTPVQVADLHGSGVHLHLLTPVSVEGRTGWYAAPLNIPARV